IRAALRVSPPSWQASRDRAGFAQIPCGAWHPHDEVSPRESRRETRSSKIVPVTAHQFDKYILKRGARSRPSQCRIVAIGRNRGFEGRRVVASDMQTATERCDHIDARSPAEFAGKLRKIAATDRVGDEPRPGDHLVHGAVAEKLTIGNVCNLMAAF